MTTCPDCKGTKVYVGLNRTEPCRGCLGTGEMLPQSHAVGMDRAEGEGGLTDFTPDDPPPTFKGVPVLMHPPVVLSGKGRKGGWVQHSVSPLEIITNAVNELLQEPTYKQRMKARISEIYREFVAYQWQKRKVVPYSSHESRPT